MSTYEMIIFECGFCLTVMGLAAKTRGFAEKLTINATLFFAGLACMFYSFAASGLILI